MSVELDRERSKGSKRVYYFRTTYTTVRGEKKRYKSKRFPSAAEAKEAEIRFLQEHDAPERSATTFNEMIDEALAEKKGTVKLVTWESYEVKTRYIRKSLGDVKIAKLTQAQYKAFLHDLSENGNTPTHNNKIIAVLKSIVDYAEKHYGITTKVPDMFPNFKDVNASKRKRLTKDEFYTLDEYMKFRSAIDSPVYLALFDVLFFEGLRIGEADALLWSDISFPDNTISISKTVCTKKRDSDGKYLVTSPKTESSNRIIPMNKVVAESLKSLRDMWEKYEGFDTSWNVFGGLDALPNSTIQAEKKRILGRYSEQTGDTLKEIRLHGFRHSAASLMVQTSPSEIPAISAFLGHSTITMTLNTYVGIHQEKMKDITSSIDKIIQP